MVIEKCRVMCDRCYGSIIKEFPEISLEGVEELTTLCIVFNHCYALCAKHLEDLANDLRK